MLFFSQTDQGIQNLSAAEANRLSAEDPDYAIRDLYNNIEDGKYPSWTLKVQIMTPEQAEKYKWNPFDVTKVSSRHLYILCYSDCISKWMVIYIM